jgi:phage/plasmid-associated DNA primase
VFGFDPTHKLFALMNHKPDVRERGEPVWNRIKLIEFPTHFHDPVKDRALLAADPTLKVLDTGLEDKLGEELEGLRLSAVSRIKMRPPFCALALHDVQFGL